MRTVDAGVGSEGRRGGVSFRARRGLRFWSRLKVLSFPVALRLGLT